jgi:hypothetical protein
VPRPKNTAKTRTLILAITPELYEILEKLARTGLIGKNPNETAENMLLKGLEGFLGGDFYKEALLGSVRKGQADGSA